MMQVVASYAMSNSSAIIWRKAVPVPWPQSVLPTEKRRGVVLVDRDPRIELPEVGVWIRASLRVDGRDGACDSENAGGAQEVAAGMAFQCGFNVGVGCR
jgi:hypothetical protein